jgi:hypothetical protein
LSAPITAVTRMKAGNVTEGGGGKAMWEDFTNGLKEQSIDELIMMASYIKEELKRRNASSAWHAVGR